MEIFFFHRNKESGLGIKVIHPMNKALISKLAWELIHKPDALWATFIKAKYFFYSNFWEARKPNACSKFWTAIISTRELLKSSTCWQICKDSKLDVYADPWIPTLPYFRPKKIQNVAFTPRIADLIESNTLRWKVEELTEIFLLTLTVRRFSKFVSTITYLKII